MIRIPTVLLVAAAVAVSPTPDAAAGDPQTCAGQVVTIDLNDPGAPDPDRGDDDVVLGTPQDDDIDTGGGEDRVCAGAGDDDVFGGSGDDHLEGGPGDDSLSGYDGVDVIYGDGGRDSIWVRGESPAGAREEAHGGAGNDSLNGSPGDELFDGGSGSDTVVYRFPCRDCGTEYPDPQGGIRVDLRLTGPQDTGTRGMDELSSIENLIGTGDDDVLLGNGEDNRLEGYFGDDKLNGRRGADDLKGGPGDDRCIGGPGHDKQSSCE